MVFGNHLGIPRALPREALTLEFRGAAKVPKDCRHLRFFEVSANVYTGGPRDIGLIIPNVTHVRSTASSAGTIVLTPAFSSSRHA